jgi:tetratricopeptide (TPR) repeat protein
MTIRIANRRSAVVVVLVLGAVAARGDGPIEKAVSLVNQGSVDAALDLLRGRLVENAKDVDARVLLGRILDFDGRPDEAVDLWEKGLAGAAGDYRLWMSIGQIRQRQGNDGPTVSYRRGMVGFSPSKDEASERRYKSTRLDQAATAFAKARSLEPDEPDAAEALAAVLTAQEKFDAAADILKDLARRSPANSKHRLALAKAALKAGRPDAAVEQLNEAIARDPRLAEAHEALAEIQKSKGQTAAAERSLKQAAFYGGLPPFASVNFSDENFKTLQSLDQEALVRKLLDDPSETATEFLATVCWMHPHNQLESDAFAALEIRGAKTTRLVRGLFDSARSTCTIRSAARILARRKSQGLFEELVRRLPGDLRVPGMNMDVAGSLDVLGDPRAVQPLVEVLNPESKDADADGGLLVDRRSARARAALALGAFDTPESRRALEAGTRDPRIAPFCWAALYRIRKEPSDLASLDQSVKADDDYEALIIGQYVLEKTPDTAARALAQAWEKRRESKAKAKAKPESEPKP